MTPEQREAITAHFKAIHENLLSLNMAGATGARSDTSSA
jgi:hypothetical protein